MPMEHTLLHALNSCCIISSDACPNARTLRSFVPNLHSSLIPCRLFVCISDWCTTTLRWARGCASRGLGWFITRVPTFQVVVPPYGSSTCAALHTMEAHFFLFHNAEAATVWPLNTVTLRTFFSHGVKTQYGVSTPVARLKKISASYEVNNLSRDWEMLWKKECNIRLNAINQPHRDWDIVADSFDRIGNLLSICPRRGFDVFASLWGRTHPHARCDHPGHECTCSSVWSGDVYMLVL